MLPPPPARAKQEGPVTSPATGAWAGLGPPIIMALPDLPLEDGDRDPIAPPGGRSMALMGAQRALGPERPAPGLLLPRACDPTSPGVHLRGRGSFGVGNSPLGSHAVPLPLLPQAHSQA